MLFRSLVATQVADGLARSVGWSEQGDGSLLVRYAAPGDTDLDGLVDVLDVANVLGSGKLNSGLPTTWFEGDFNYDGLLDILDMADFMSSGLLNAGWYNDAPVGLVAVPEPAATGAALALLACAGLRRRNRQRPRRRRLATSTTAAATPRADGSGTAAMLAAGGPL